MITRPFRSVAVFPNYHTDNLVVSDRRVPDPSKVNPLSRLNEIVLRTWKSSVSRLSLCGMLSETISCRTRASTYASLDVCRRGKRVVYTYKEQGVIILIAENIHTHPPDSRSSPSSVNWVVHNSKMLCRQLCYNK